MRRVTGRFWRWVARGLALVAATVLRWERFAAQRSVEPPAGTDADTGGPPAHWLAHTGRGGPPAHWLGHIAARAPHLVAQFGQAAQEDTPPGRNVVSRDAMPSTSEQRAPRLRPPAAQFPSVVQADAAPHDREPPMTAQPRAPRRDAASDTTPTRPLRLRPLALSVTEEVPARLPVPTPTPSEPAPPRRQMPPPPPLLQRLEERGDAVETRPPQQPQPAQKPDAAGHAQVTEAGAALLAADRAQRLPSAPDLLPRRRPAWETVAVSQTPPTRAAEVAPPVPRFPHVSHEGGAGQAMTQEQGGTARVPDRWTSLEPSPTPTRRIGTRAEMGRGTPRQADAQPRRAVTPAADAATALPAEYWPLLPDLPAPGATPEAGALWRAWQRRRRLELEQEGRLWSA